ncbi:hypothetical protein HJC23_008687 [Cyclotella cryptica]|uniref:Dihydropteridine reductase n=1 Tax=Cyclotella cryptica TaxID=29204 RepID=A0ABD3QP97_9STRA
MSFVMKSMPSSLAVAASATSTGQISSLQTFHSLLGQQHRQRPNPHRTNLRSIHNGQHRDLKTKSNKHVLILGSRGVLGSTLADHLSDEWNILGADVVPSQDSFNDYIRLPQHGSVADLSLCLYRGISQHIGDKKLDAIICASGGWAGDVDPDIGSGGEEEEEEYVKEAAGVVERMMRVNYYPVVAGSLVGQKFMNRGGMFIIIGASAALSPTPGMIGYGSSKAAAHHYLQTFGADTPVTSVGILPLMLDTPANRAMLAGDDDNDDRYTKLVKPIQIAQEIGEWIRNPHLRPHSGSLVKVIAKNRKDGSGGAAFHLVR